MNPSARTKQKCNQIMFNIAWFLNYLTVSRGFFFDWGFSHVCISLRKDVFFWVSRVNPRSQYIFVWKAPVEQFAKVIKNNARWNEWPKTQPDFYVNFTHSRGFSYNFQYVLFVYLIRALFRMKKTGDVAKVPKEQWIIKPEEDNFLVVERQIFSIHFRY